MNVLDYFKERRRENDELFLEFTEEELSRLRTLRNNLIILAIIELIFSWTGIGLILLLITFLYYSNKMEEIRSKVYRRKIEKRSLVQKVAVA